MDDLKVEEEVKEEGELLLDLSLSLVSQNYSTDHNRNTRRKINSNIQHSITSLGSSDGGSGGDHYDDHEHQIKMVRVLQHREQMLRRPTPSPSSSADRQNLQLMLQIASSLDEHNFRSAISDLIKLYETASLTGVSVQRVAAYFADAFTAKLLKEPTPTPTPAEELLAFTHLYRASPCFQFSHFTANQAILEAFHKEQSTQGTTKLHVLDFDLAYGFQWPSLVQSLSDKATPTNPISLRITGFATTMEHLVDTEARLVSFANGFTNLVFDFQGLLFATTTDPNFTHSLVTRRENETVAVNLVTTCLLHSPTKSNYSNTLTWIRSLQPSVVILVEQGSGRSHVEPGAYLMDSVHYYTALFGSLDECLPRDSLERLCIERNLLGKHIKSAVLNCCPTVEQLGRMMEENGFCGITFSSTTLMQAKLLLRMRNHNHPPAFCQPGFRVSQSHSGKAISLVWQDTELLTASAWHLR